MHERLLQIYGGRIKTPTPVQIERWIDQEDAGAFPLLIDTFPPTKEDLKEKEDGEIGR